LVSHGITPSESAIIVEAWLVEIVAMRKAKPVHLVGGVTASTEVIAVKRHTGVHASVIVCKNTIANQQLAYAA